MHKKSSLMLFLAVVWSLPCVVWAGDGFTQQDREMLIQLNVKVHELEKRVDQRLDQVDKRFLELRTDMNKRFVELRTDMNKRFGQVDNRFVELRADMNKRLGQVDNRFVELRSDMNKSLEQVNNRLGDMFQLIVGILATFGGIVAVAISFALWDRRTMIRPFEAKVEKIEEKIAGNKKQIKSLIKAMRELAPSNPKVAEVLRSFSLL